MGKRRIYDQERHAHFVTFSCYRRRRLLDDDRAKRILLGTFNAQLRRFSGRCIGFVVMPNHVHAIVWFPRTGCLSEFMKQWKRTSSLRIRQLFDCTLKAYGQSIANSAVWQAKYYSFNLFSSAKIEEKLNYMHLNPVRAGLVNDAGDWRWSSARYYQFGRSVGVKVAWIE
jgi:putative transposase